MPLGDRQFRRLKMKQQRHCPLSEARFSQATRRAPVPVLGVRDEYCFMQPDLVAILRARIARHLP